MKWTIARKRELNRKTIVEKAIDKRIARKEGTDQPGISERHFRRLFYKYRKRGDEGFASGPGEKPGDNLMK